MLRTESGSKGRTFVFHSAARTCPKQAGHAYRSDESRTWEPICSIDAFRLISAKASRFEHPRAGSTAGYARTYASHPFAETGRDRMARMDKYSPLLFGNAPTLPKAPSALSPTRATSARSSVAVPGCLEPAASTHPGGQGLRQIQAKQSRSCLGGIQRVARGRGDVSLDPNESALGEEGYAPIPTFDPPRSELHPWSLLDRDPFLGPFPGPPIREEEREGGTSTLPMAEPALSQTP
ncbi:hypothetical protein KM043_001490 [Ampulex compressa]|nr:hypothetical protein KM043_001490 [Ampulex compressa]